MKRVLLGFCLGLTACTPQVELFALEEAEKVIEDVVKEEERELARP